MPDNIIIKGLSAEDNFLNYNNLLVNKDGSINSKGVTGGFSNPSYDAILIAKDGTYIKFYKNSVLVKQLDLYSDATDDVIEEVPV